MQTRRQLLQTAAFGAGTALFTGCDRTISELTKAMGQAVPASLPVPTSTEIDPEFHLLSRAAFGPWPGDVQRVKRLGRAAWIEQQLRPEKIDDSLCDLRAERFESLQFSAGNAYEFRKEVLRDEITRHTLLRAIYSQRQLFEVMVEFWTDHLNIDLEKGDCVYLKPSDDRDVIRQHALGKFKDLIRASATSPAMLVYLDGKANKVRAKTKDVPNENYARELMELHTLGVDGGYTQTDVREAARCLTGWTFDRSRTFALNAGESYFRDDWHDDGEKRVLGQVIPAGGKQKDLEALVDIVCNHPSTAKFIAKKLCVRFVSYTPPQSIVDRVAAEFTRTGGDIKSMLRVLLNSDEFMAARGQLLKRPLKFMVSALRALATDTHVPARGPLVDYLGRMGHGLYQYPTPDGYPDEETPWMGTLMWRWNFSLALCEGKLGEVRVPMAELEKALGSPKDPATAAARWWAHLIGRAATEAEVQSVIAAASKSDLKNEPKAKAELLGVILAGPAFQKC